jgi:2-iminobutanoate/2-iminopropanoate deaminase
VTEYLISDQLPTPGGPYSHVTVAGSMIWTAGFGPADPTTGDVPEGIEAQTQATMGDRRRSPV